MSNYYWEEKTPINICEKYVTYWKGYFKNKNIDSKWINQNDIKKINTLLAEKYDIMFHIQVDESNIYFSIGGDDRYYYYDFEKHILKIIKDIEKMFNVKIEEGCFEAWECRPEANMFKYIISKENKKCILKKTVVNIQKYENKKNIKLKT